MTNSVLACLVDGAGQLVSHSRSNAVSSPTNKKLSTANAHKVRLLTPQSAAQGNTANTYARTLEPADLVDLLLNL